jgi:hypothetical protein
MLHSLSSLITIPVLFSSLMFLFLFSWSILQFLLLQEGFTGIPDRAWYFQRFHPRIWEVSAQDFSNIIDSLWNGFVDGPYQYQHGILSFNSGEMNTNSGYCLLRSTLDLFTWKFNNLFMKQILINFIKNVMPSKCFTQLD